MNFVEKNIIWHASGNSITRFFNGENVPVHYIGTWFLYNIYIVMQIRKVFLSVRY